MNRAHITTVLSLCVVGGLYWLAVCQITETKEPWDSDAYWHLWYPVSLALSAIAGYFIKEDGWLAGPLLTFAQLPVMWLNNGIGPLILVGMVFMFVLAVPAVAISFLASLFAMRVRST